MTDQLHDRPAPSLVHSFPVPVSTDPLAIVPSRAPRPPQYSPHQGVLGMIVGFVFGVPLGLVVGALVGRFAVGVVLCISLGLVLGMLADRRAAPH